MTRKMELDELNDLFAANRDFELTDAQYEERVGKPLPQTKQAITGKNTPLGRKAAEYGFKIHVEERLMIQRVVICVKEDDKNEKV